MPLTFRNLAVSPDAPVDRWGVEGILAAIDRGGIDDWQRVAAAVYNEPHGWVARDLESALDLAESPSSAQVLRLALDRARETPEQRVARKIRQAIRRSGLTQAEAAARLGTSPSRLSTYTTGKVCPSAATMERICDLTRPLAAPPA